MVNPNSGCIIGVEIGERDELPICELFLFGNDGIRPVDDSFGVYPTLFWR